MNIVSRKQAKEKGLKTYFTGKPCAKGHVVERNVGFGDCKECISSRNKKYHKKHQTKISSSKKEYYSENKEKIVAYAKNWNEENKERHLENTLKWARENKEYVNEYARTLRKNNPEYAARQRQLFKDWLIANQPTPEFKAKSCDYTARRRAKKVRATPCWRHDDKISEIYHDCAEINIINKMCGGDDTFVVDHRIPLQGKTVCGLHVEHNLQIITNTDNGIKHNKLLEEFSN